MNIEKWIEENSDTASWCGTGDVDVIEVSKLLEILKTHAIVPREPSDDVVFDIWNDCTSGHQMDTMETKEVYLEVIKAAENEY